MRHRDTTLSVVQDCPSGLRIVNQQHDGKVTSLFKVIGLQKDLYRLSLWLLSQKRYLGGAFLSIGLSVRASLSRAVLIRISFRSVIR